MSMIFDDNVDYEDNDNDENVGANEIGARFDFWWRFRMTIFDDSYDNGGDDNNNNDCDDDNDD